MAEKTDIDTVTIIGRSHKAKRTCLKCNVWINSRGPHSRRCGRCNERIPQAPDKYFMPEIYKEKIEHGEKT